MLIFYNFIGFELSFVDNFEKGNGLFLKWLF